MRKRDSSMLSALRRRDTLTDSSWGMLLANDEEKVYLDIMYELDRMCSL